MTTDPKKKKPTKNKAEKIIQDVESMIPKSKRGKTPFPKPKTRLT
jgi:hypothetical protein